MAGSIIVYKKPEIIVKFYLDSVRQLQSIPKKLKANDSIEQAILQPIHILLQDSVGYNDSVNSFSTVPSTHNQQIKAYWSKSRQGFIGVLRKELKEMTEEWSEHIISKNSNGGPSQTWYNYVLPHIFDCQDYSDPLKHDIDELLPAAEEIPHNYTAEFGESAEIIMTKEGIEMPVDVKNCLNLYLLLLEKIEEFSLHLAMNI